MTPEQETEMHDLARKLYELTKGTSWEAGRYMQIGTILEMMTHYCATCQCQVRRNLGNGDSQEHRP